MRICRKCGKSKNETEFYKSLSRNDGLRSSCIDCDNASGKQWYKKNRDKVCIKNKNWRLGHPEKVQENNDSWRRYNPERHRENYSTWYRKNKDKRRSADLMRSFGINLDDYNKMLEAQDHKCAICGKPQSDFKKSFAVDHNHSTGEIRGLLCSFCNTAIGLLDENTDILRKAIDFLTPREKETKVFPKNDDKVMCDVHATQ